MTFPIKKTIILALVFSFLYPNCLIPQCTEQVIHDTGIATVGCTIVEVGTIGHTSLNDAYCNVTAPYFIGWIATAPSNVGGGFQFTFTPPVEAVSLNFSGISNDTNAISGTSEEIHILVNGSHYAIPSAGTENDCDPLAVLTAAGNVAGCPGCSVSGWIGTTISGPISSLLVMDSVLIGEPAGALFSLFICEQTAADFEVSLGKNTLLCLSETLNLDVFTENATYLWQDGTTNSNFTISQAGTYWVEVTQGCVTITDTLLVEIENCDCDIYFPNAFSPNNDGINDYYAPLFNCDFLAYEFSIFDRWGEKVFETLNPNDKWDGAFRGKKAPTGVYVYLLSYQYPKQNKDVKIYSSFTLLRG